MTDTCIATLQAVSVGYGRTVVNHDISFSLPSGQITCLLGTNGSGKTTLMRTLLGLIPAFSGQIHIAEKPIAAWSARSLAQVAAYVPQAHDSPFAFRVLDMVLMGCHPRLSLFSTPGKREAAHAEAVLSQLGILSLSQRSYATLSGGERQRVLIARALIQQPLLMVMDEPAASLDFGNQIRLLAHIRQLKESGMAVLMSTHHPQHARAVADNVVLLHPGAGTEQGSPDVLLTPTRLAALYGVKEADIHAHFRT
ncbi:ABC transporter ATP-binding protein [Pectobacterium versatile]|uniref:ABC transporter ATP-binding protein n=1 Tax=Pectobacterium versatile TaxID=2488639 RepID=UPI001938EB79|nr:ABC transporter ATP-binding protein [Pectobacterium versatile]QQK73760.1 ABC transporter ATP-binding protein [Pectobacterium versatile]